MLTHIDATSPSRATALGRSALTGLLVVFVLAGIALLHEGRASAAGLAALSQFPSSDALERPQSIAVDKASGDVYVIEVEQQSVDKFDSAGHPVAFSASGSYIDANQLTGTPGERFAFDQPSAAEIAIDDSGGAFNGDIYVTDSLHHVIDVFAPSGVYLGQLNGSGTPQFSFTEPCGVAVDGSGRVYVGDAGGFVERYRPTASATPISDTDYAVSEISVPSGEPCAVAVDAAGDVFASTWPTGPLNEFAHSQFPASGSAAGVAKEIDTTSQAVAVDPSTGAVYVDEGTQIAVYTISAGIPTLSETFGSLSGESYGLGVDDPSGSAASIYTADQGAKPAPTVDVFGTARPAPPTVVSESAANVTGNSASLQAQLNPNFASTTYHFEYGITTSYGAQRPIPDTAIGSGGGLAGVQNVTVQIQGLQPDTTYHYRVLAENASGTVKGQDATFTTQPASGALVLPDGRAWEMVSPPDKNNALITGIDGVPLGTLGGLPQAEANGESLVYASEGAFAHPSSAPLSAQYLATRGGNGWSTVDITPPIVSESYGIVGVGGPYKAFSADLTSGLLLNGGFKPIENLPLTSDAPAGYQDFYLQGLETGSFQAILTKTNSSTPSESSSAFELELQGATPDLSHMVFSTTAKLTTNATDNGERNLYEWSGGQLQLVNLLPDETLGTPGAVLGEDAAGNPGGMNAISTDGSVIYFTLAGNLYARVNGTSTIAIDASDGGPESGEGVFQTASSDGSRVFFTDSRRLTSDSTATHEGPSDLYEYDLRSGELSDLTVTDPRGAGVQRVLGASEDGSYVYFVANGVLAPGAVRGHCALGISGGGPQTCNLYLWRRGSPITFITTLSEDDNTAAPQDRPENEEEPADWAATIHNRTSRVAADGLNLVFMSNGNLTGYDNRNVETGHSVQEVYSYNAATGVLHCVSCDPSGARPTGPSSIPAGTQFENAQAIYQSRVLSDVEGHARVFFNSSDALATQDINRKQDVYEWEEDGRGNCDNANGCVALISSGTSSGESSFLDASSNGSNVFFLTYAELAPQDTDQLLDIYDAREGGGFPSGPAASHACEDEACAAPPTQIGTPGGPLSSLYTGLGNPPPVKAKSVKAKHKQSKAKQKKKKAKQKKKKKKKKHKAKKTDTTQGRR